MTAFPRLLFLFLTYLPVSWAFAPPSQLSKRHSRASALEPLNFFGKVFEEEGLLGKGITVGKVQVALIASDRGKDSIFGELERKARSTGDSEAHLALLAKEVCLAGRRQ